jgi:uncharacterized phage protein (TIGR02218 family)
MSDFATAQLGPALTRLALCWRVVRGDGVALGFTTHDAALNIDGLSYASAPGMAPSAIMVSDGLDVDTMEVDGALSADAITAADLAAGCYDAAVVQIFMVDWSNLAAGRFHLARGRLGEVTRRLSGGGGSFTAALRGPTADFEATAIETYTPECRAELGDARCRVDLAQRQRLARVTGVIDRQTFELDGGAVDDFANGRLRTLAGGNAGIDVRIAAASGTTVEFFEPLPFALSVGTRVEIREGCDKSFATCSARFANAANFRGEPHVPGGDVLTRFPGI